MLITVDVKPLVHVCSHVCWNAPLTEQDREEPNIQLTSSVECIANDVSWGHQVTQLGVIRPKASDKH